MARTAGQRPHRAAHAAPRPRCAPRDGAGAPRRSRAARSFRRRLINSQTPDSRDPVIVQASECGTQQSPWKRRRWPQGRRGSRHHVGPAHTIRVLPTGRMGLCVHDRQVWPEGRPPIRTCAGRGRSALRHGPACFRRPYISTAHLRSARILHAARHRRATVRRGQRCPRTRRAVNCARTADGCGNGAYQSAADRRTVRAWWITPAGDAPPCTAAALHCW